MQPYNPDPPHLSKLVNIAELVFEVAQEADGGFCAECLTENIFTQADSWDELRHNILEAVNAFYFDRQPPLIAHP